MSYFKRFLLPGRISVALLVTLMLTLIIGTHSTMSVRAASCNSTATGNWSNNCQISEGNISNFVYSIQEVINISGLCPGITADGDFGSQTLGGVKCFQKAEGLTADGIVGPLTWGKLQGVLRLDFTESGWYYWHRNGDSGVDLWRESTSNLGWQVFVFNSNSWCTMNFNHC